MQRRRHLQSLLLAADLESLVGESDRDARLVNADLSTINPEVARLLADGLDDKISALRELAERCRARAAEGSIDALRAAADRILASETPLSSNGAHALQLLMANLPPASEADTAMDESPQ